METFNNDGMSNYLVVYIRLLATGQLHEKSEEYMPFVDGLYRNMKEFCDKVGRSFTCFLVEFCRNSDNSNRKF